MMQRDLGTKEASRQAPSKHSEVQLSSNAS